MKYSGAYLAEQIVNGLLCLVLGSIFALQIISEKYSYKRIVAVKKLFHRVGLLIVLLNAIRGIDPSGVHGILDQVQIAFISGNVTCLLMLCLAAATFYIISAVYGLQMTARPPILRRVMVAGVIVMFIVTNSLYIAMAAYDREFYRGIVYVWWAITFGGLIVICALAIRHLRNSINLMINSPSRGQAPDKTMLRSLNKLLILQIAGLIISVVTVAGLLYFGIRKISRPSHPVESMPHKSYPTLWNMQLLLQWVALVVFTWWSWITLYVCRRSAHKKAGHTDAEADTHTRTTTDERRKPLLSGRTRASMVASVTVSVTGTDTLVDTRSSALSRDNNDTIQADMERRASLPDESGTGGYEPPGVTVTSSGQQVSYGTCSQPQMGTATSFAHSSDNTADALEQLRRVPSTHPAIAIIFNQEVSESTTFAGQSDGMVP